MWGFSRFESEKIGQTVSIRAVPRKVAEMKIKETQSDASILTGSLDLDHHA